MPWPSSRRRRRSPRTFPAPSGSPSPSGGPASSARAIVWPDDALVVCSFGDASANHSTATGAINTAARVAYQHLPLPLLFVCEDNGLGISVRTPPGWIAAAYGHRPHLRYVAVDGTDPAAVFDAVRGAGRPGSASSRSRRSCTSGACGSAAMPARTWRPATGCPRRSGPTTSATRCSGRLACWSPSGAASAEEVRRPLPPHRRRGAGTGRAAPGHADADDRRRGHGAARSAHADGRGRAPPPSAAAPDRRAAWFGGTLPEAEGPLTLARRSTARWPTRSRPVAGLLVFGEDVAAKGGVYGVTRGLLKRAGAARVLRHGARRAVDPRPGPRRRGVGPAARARDPVPRLPPQRRGPAAGRGGHALVLLQRSVPQRHGGARARATATRRASAATSTTTTPSPCCATSPVSSSPRPVTPPTPPRCCGPAWPPPRWTAR